MASTVLVAQADTASSEAAHDVAAAPAGETHEVVGAASEHEATTIFPPFDATTFGSQILWFVLAFAVLYFLMSRLALPQIGSIIDKRKARIDGDLKEAERLRGETDKAIASYEAALADARKNAHGIAEETRQSIRADIEAKRKAVEDDLSKKVGEAEARIGKTKDEALGRVSEIAAETAAALVTQLTGEANAKDVEAAVADAVKG